MTPLGMNEFLNDLDVLVRVVGFAILLALITPLVVRGVRSRRLRHAADEELEAARETARGELVAVGEVFRELDLDAEMPDADPAGRDALAAAIELYHRADRELAAAATRPKLDGARATLAAARDQATIARRRLSHDDSSSSGSGRVSP